jgi:hypothetical protein
LEIAEARERYAALKEKIDYHNHLYYDLDAPELDDYAYDALTRELKALEAEHPEFVNENSPTQHVGGVASGPMTATFLLPFAMGACEALGGNVMTDAFGIVAMVAMTPLITIQMMGFITQMKEKAKRRYIEVQMHQLEDDILYFD